MRIQIITPVGTFESVSYNDKEKNKRMVEFFSDTFRNKRKLTYFELETPDGFVFFNDEVLRQSVIQFIGVTQ